jgi:hypothetical protein
MFARVNAIKPALIGLALLIPVRNDKVAPHAQD